MSGRFLAGALALSVIAALPAAAADLSAPFDPDAGQPADKVEFGTGWYIRGDVGWARESMPLPSPNTVFTPPVGQAVPAVAYDPGTSNKTGFVGSLGSGYQFTSHVRVEAMLDYRRPTIMKGQGQPTYTCQTGLTETGKCTPFYKIADHNWDVMFNGYYDFGPFGGFTPYVGAGVGMTWGVRQNAVYWIQGNNVPYNLSWTDGNGELFSVDWDRSKNTYYYQFAWNVMAGVSYDIMPHVKLDLGYRFISLGKLTGVSIDGGTFTKNLTSQEVRLGMRYMID